MLAGDFGVADYDPGHPDADKFYLTTSHIYKDLDSSFSLVFCDGQVLRTHTRAPYRERFEASRLSLSQLVIAMRRIRQGGTFIMLLHKVEAWKSLQLLRCFGRFSKVRLFKPEKKHASRSSFYMIAQEIDASHAELQNAIEQWKHTWLTLTFRRSDSSEPSEPSVEEVEELLTEYGETLVELAEPIWKIQLRGLKTAKWNK